MVHPLPPRAYAPAMAAGANVFTTAWGFQHGGVSAAAGGQHAGAELLGASVLELELEPGARWADLHVHFANLRVFQREDGRPVPPGEGPAPAT
jgi:hypothetical protein